jgi:hypothetical protein
VLAAYIRVLAANALYSASLGVGSDGHAQWVTTASFELQQALEGLQIGALSSNPAHALAAQISEKLRARITEARFFGRQFDAANRDYAEANKGARPEIQMTTTWGQLICAMGLEDMTAAAGHLLTLSNMLQADVASPVVVRRLRDAVALLYELDRQSPIFKRLSSDQITRLPSWRDDTRSEEARYTVMLDFLRVYTTIDRFDLAARLAMREIRHVHINADPRSSAREAHYLRELGATMVDAFTALSWIHDAEGEARPILSDPRAFERLFAPVLEDRVLGNGRPGSYGSGTPEEDLATVFSLYAGGAGNKFLSRVSPTFSALDDLASRELGIRSVESSKPGVRFASWVMERASQGQIEPWLKLVYVEWFGIPMHLLTDPAISAKTWVYAPVNDSTVTDPERVEKALSGLSMSTASRGVWEIYKEVRQFLTAQYGGKP